MTDLHGVRDLFLLRHGAQVTSRSRSRARPRLSSVHTHGQSSLEHRLLAALVLGSSDHLTSSLLTSTCLRLLTGSLLLHRDSQSQSQLRVVVRVDSELEASASGSGCRHPVLALEDGAGDEGVTEVRAGGDGHQVGPGPLLPVDGRDELVEDVRVGVVLAKVDNVDVDLNTIYYY